jgi:hypothetical protein
VQKSTPIERARVSTGLGYQILRSRQNTPLQPKVNPIDETFMEFFDNRGQFKLISLTG